VNAPPAPRDMIRYNVSSGDPMSNAHTQGIPGMDAMNETLDFVKNLWGGMTMPGMNMKIPGMIMPTLSVEEINKQIADLKTVESWLTLNMNMLRSTIQALEVQSATISTLQAMGESLSAAVKPAPREEPPVAARKPAPEPEPEPEPEAKPPEAAAVPKAKAAPQADAATAALANPAMWWNMLQDQFKQAVDSAMTAEAPKASKTAAAKPAPAKSASAKAAPAKAAKKSGPKAGPKAAAPKAVAKTSMAKHAGTKGG
jgi:hypothetical protein